MVAQADLTVAAAAIAPEAAAAAAELISLAASRGTQLERLVQPEIVRLIAQLRADGLSDTAEVFVAARLRLTMTIRAAERRAPSNFNGGGQFKNASL